MTSPAAGRYYYYYYYGACVDAVAGEADNANNLLGSRAGRRGAASRADQTRPGGGPARSDRRQPGRRAAFTLSAEARNAGNGDAAATSLRYYRSADATVNASDTEVGTDAVAGLPASATSS